MNEKAKTGNFFEDFRLGQEIVHATPRTVTDGDVALYTALYGGRFAINSSNPFAASLGLDRAPVDSLLAFHIVFATLGVGLPLMIALAELLGGIVPLLHQGSKHGKSLFIFEGPGEFNLLVLESCFHHPEDGKPQLFPGLHGSHKIFFHLF